MKITMQQPTIPPEPNTSPRDIRSILLISIIALGTLLRINELGLKSLWVDEIGQVWYARIGPIAAIKGAMTHVAAAPLDYVVTSLMAMLDKTDFGLRMPAMIWGVLAIYFIYRIGSSVLGSPVIGLCAAFLLAVSPTHIEYSQEIRFYSLFTLLSIISVLMFARALERGTWVSWMGFATVLILSALTHYYTVFVILVLGIFALLIAGGTRTDRMALFRLRPDLRFLIPFAASVACAIGAIGAWYMLSGGGRPSPFTFTFPSATDIFAAPLSGLYWPNHLIGYGVFPALALVGLGLGLARRQPWVIVLTLIPAVAVAGTLALDSTFSYFYTPRQILFTVPFYILLVAVGIVYGATALLRRPAIANGAAAIIAIIIGGLLTPQIQAYYAYPKANWRDTALFLRGALTHSDTILALDPDPLNTYLLYYEPSLKQYIVPRATLSSLAATGPAPQRIWLVAEPSAAVSPPEGWQKVEVSGALGRFHLYYMGSATVDSLWKEVEQINLPLSLAAQSNMLYALARDQPQIAAQSARDLIGQFESKVQPLTGNEAGMLLTKAGRVLFDTGEQAAGVGYVERARGYNLRDQDAINTLGYMYLQQKRCDDAVSVLEGSPRLNDNYWANNFLGSAYRCQEQWVSAANAYHMAFTIQDNPDMLLIEAQMYLNAGATDRATPLLSEVRERFPNTPAAAQAEQLLSDPAAAP
nr:glycosyltransferase family 39 protein [Oscillochloris sp. ZM17-4]